MGKENRRPDVDMVPRFVPLCNPLPHSCERRFIGTSIQVALPYLIFQISVPNPYGLICGALVVLLQVFDVFSHHFTDKTFRFLMRRAEKPKKLKNCFSFSPELFTAFS